MGEGDSRLAAAGLFAGIGGLELGLRSAGFDATLLCELDPDARAVLSARFGGVDQHDDVTTLTRLPAVSVVTAGFPCQDLSMAGARAGITGSRSGLVGALLELLRRGPAPRWLVIENVPYMLSLAKGRAMAWLTEQLEALGMRWAHRVVDARAFGVPQRRLRVILCASRTEDPRAVLFADDAEASVDDSTSIADPSLAYGFYWTEGRRGLGWTVDGVPTIKGGSSIGIPSPPAIWIRETGEIGTPDIRDTERLQGFPSGFTAAADRRARWRLLGNAVCVPVARWVAQRLLVPGDVVVPARPWGGGRWPRAAWGGPGEPVHAALCSTWPTAQGPRIPLRSFLRHPLQPLSARATRGYLGRTDRATSLRFPPGFLSALSSHLETMEGAAWAP